MTLDEIREALKWQGLERWGIVRHQPNHLWLIRMDGASYTYTEGPEGGWWEYRSPDESVICRNPHMLPTAPYDPHEAALDTLYEVVKDYPEASPTRLALLLEPA